MQRPPPHSWHPYFYYNRPQQFGQQHGGSGYGPRPLPTGPSEIANIDIQHQLIIVKERLRAEEQDNSRMRSELLSNRAEKAKLQKQMTEKTESLDQMEGEMKFLLKTQKCQASEPEESSEKRTQTEEPFIDPAEKKALERTRADLERWNEKMQVEIERIQQMDIQLEFREKKLLQREMRNEAFGVELEAARKDKKYVMHKNKKLKSEKKKAEKKIANLERHLDQLEEAEHRLEKANKFLMENERILMDEKIRLNQQFESNQLEEAQLRENLTKENVDLKLELANQKSANEAIRKHFKLIETEIASLKGQSHHFRKEIQRATIHVLDKFDEQHSVTDQKLQNVTKELEAMLQGKLPPQPETTGGNANNSSGSHVKNEPND